MSRADSRTRSAAETMLFQASPSAILFTATLVASVRTCTSESAYGRKRRKCKKQIIIVHRHVRYTAAKGQYLKVRLEAVDLDLDAGLPALVHAAELRRDELDDALRWQADVAVALDHQLLVRARTLGREISRDRYRKHEAQST